MTVDETLKSAEVTYTVKGDIPNEKGICIRSECDPGCSHSVEAAPIDVTQMQ